MITKILFQMYKINNNRLREVIIRSILRLENGDIYSQTIRDVLSHYHKVKIGRFTHGGCFIPSQVDSYTEIGNYCSTAPTIHIFNRNHPMENFTTHGFFFNPKLGLNVEDTVGYIPLVIGHDVWMGQNAIVMPQVQNIGIGAVVGAGAVVHKNIPPYAVVVGNPARVVRYRFPKPVIDRLIASKWWELDILELKKRAKEYNTIISDV